MAILYISGGSLLDGRAGIVVQMHRSAQANHDYCGLFFPALFRAETTSYSPNKEDIIFLSEKLRKIFARLYYFLSSRIGFESLMIFIWEFDKYNSNKCMNFQLNAHNNEDNNTILNSTTHSQNGMETDKERHVLDEESEDEILDRKDQDEVEAEKHFEGILTAF